MSDRDFQLVGVAEEVADAVAGHAMATIAVLHKDARIRTKHGRQVEIMKEIVQRFSARTVSLLPYALEYHVNMSETQLRAWAANLAKALAE